MGESEGAAVAEVIIDHNVAAGAGVLAEEVAGDWGRLVGIVVLAHFAEVGVGA